jgi:hypothetical protein
MDVFGYMFDIRNDLDLLAYQIQIDQDLSLLNIFLISLVLYSQ